MGDRVRANVNNFLGGKGPIGGLAVYKADMTAVATPNLKGMGLSPEEVDATTKMTASAQTILNKATAKVEVAPGAAQTAAPSSTSSAWSVALSGLVLLATAAFAF